MTEIPPELVFKGELQGDPVTGEDHRVRIDAVNNDDGFVLTIRDSASWPVRDLYATLTVSPRDVPVLVAALGVPSTADLVKEYANAIASGRIEVIERGGIERLCVSRWFDDNSVPYHYESVLLDN